MTAMLHLCGVGETFYRTRRSPTGFNLQTRQAPDDAKKKRRVGRRPALFPNRSSRTFLTPPNLLLLLGSTTSSGVCVLSIRQVYECRIGNGMPRYTVRKSLIPLHRGEGGYMTVHRTDQANRAPHCQHQKLNGSPCGAPALRGRRFC